MDKSVHRRDGKEKKKYTKRAEHPVPPSMGHYFTPDLECGWCGVSWFSHRENPLPCFNPEGVDPRGVASNLGLFYRLMKVYKITYKELIAEGNREFEIKLVSMMSRGTAERGGDFYLPPPVARRKVWRDLVKLVRVKHGRKRLREKTYLRLC